MHVVQALAALSIGGSELVAAELTEHLIGRGCRVTVLAAPGPLTRRVREAGAELLEWPVNRKRLTTLRQIGRLRDWLRDQRPDVFHVHSRLPGLLSWRAIRGLSGPDRPALVTSMHGHYSVGWYSSMMARGDAVIAVSDAIRSYTLHHYPVPPERVAVVHGGIDHGAFPFGHQPSADWRKAVEAEFPEIAGRRWLCLPGRLSRYKGHADFIALVASLTPEAPDLQGLIIGAAKPGSRYRDELEGLAEEHGILDRITFTGVREDIREWMAASDLIFNLCSDPPEAFGRTVLEALSLGRPVLAWNHGGVAEILGRMYPQGALPPDEIESLRDRTRAFLSAPPPVPESDAFSLEASMNATWKVYGQAIERARQTEVGP